MPQADVLIRSPSTGAAGLYSTESPSKLCAMLRRKPARTIIPQAVSLSVQQGVAHMHCHTTAICANLSHDTKAEPHSTACASCWPPPTQSQCQVRHDVHPDLDLRFLLGAFCAGLNSSSTSMASSSSSSTSRDSLALATPAPGNGCSQSGATAFGKY